MSRINLQPVRSAFVELLKERPEPVRMLVINCYRLFQTVVVAVCVLAHEASRFLVRCLRTPLRSSLFLRKQIGPVAARFFQRGFASPFGYLCVVSTNQYFGNFPATVFRGAGVVGKVEKRVPSDGCASPGCYR